MLPFEVAFPPEFVADLRDRLRRTRWLDLPFDLGWERGTDDATLRDLVGYWADGYDFGAAEAELNALTNLRGSIEGEQLHCLVYEGRGNRRVPLLLLHGWPGSFVEFLDAAPILAGGDGNLGFDVVVPSLPGFGFSEAPRAPGMHEGRIAERLHRLMGELGFDRYGVQGGDWGAVIGTALALQQPDALIGLHLSFSFGELPAPDGEEPSADERRYLEFRERWNRDNFGFYDIQSTRPQTLALAQHDSPAGLLSWILEKFWAWSDHGDDLWRTFSRDRLLTNVLLYWLNSSALGAASLYYEAAHASRDYLGGFVTVPTGYLRSPADPWGAPAEMVARRYNVVHATDAPRGGHFAAMEEPGIFAADVASFFRALPG
jgi:pimeloyl-ACP methyl ester carboxylesterase